jgi:hypothetical protein
MIIKDKLTPQCIKDLGLMNQFQLAEHLKTSYRNTLRLIYKDDKFGYPIKYKKRLFYHASLVDLYVNRYPFKISERKEKERTENLQKISKSIEDYMKSLEENENV